MGLLMWWCGWVAPQGRGWAVLTHCRGGPPRRRPRQSHNQDPAVPAPVRPSPPHHPRQTQDPQNPTRLAMGPRPSHRLGTPANPALRLTHPPPTQPTSTTRPNRGTRRPPEHHRDHHHTQNHHLYRSRPRIQTIMELWIRVNDLGQ
jgi:hypothetical protein